LRFALDLRPNVAGIGMLQRASGLIPVANKMPCHRAMAVAAATEAGQVAGADGNSRADAACRLGLAAMKAEQQVWCV
jgi:hypothetical protein